MAQVPVNLELLPKQRLFLTSTADEVCYSGGFGAGKTIMVCARALVRTVHPRAVEVLCCDTVENAKERILPTLFEGSGKTPPLLPPTTYRWLKSEKMILINNGGVIRYRGLGATQKHNLERMKFRGQNVTGVGLDQLEELSLKQYINATGRTRTAGDGLTRSVYSSANPGAPSNWIAERFGIMPSHNPIEMPRPLERTITGPDGAKIRLEVIMTAPAENPHLPADYIARLAMFTGVMRLRYVLGMWVASEGVVYDNFSRMLNVKTRTGPWARSLVAIDDGISKPAAILLVRVDANGRVHVERECHRAGMLTREKVEITDKFAASAGGVDVVVVDPAAAPLKAELRAAGFTVMDGVNDVLPGISVVRQSIGVGPDGEPMLTIDPSCERTIAETELYAWDPNAKMDKVVKENDHGPDAIRYACMHLHTPPPVVFDLAGCAAAEAAAKREAPPLVGALTHTEEDAREQDIAIAKRDADQVAFELITDGPMRAWMPRTSTQHPARHGRYVIAASVGDAGAASVLVAGDLRRRAVVAEWCKAVAPERLARVAAMMAMWLGGEDGPVAVGFLAGPLSTPGEVFGQWLARLNGVPQEWRPTQREFAEQVGLLRAAWESRQVLERDPGVFATARQYIYAQGNIVHASVAHSPERRGSHADGVIARTVLWRMMCEVPPESIPPRYAPPGSRDRHRRDREAREARTKQIRYS